MAKVTALELSLSRRYVSDWGAEEAVREILQNAIDRQADGAEVEVSYARETLSVRTLGASLDRSTLLLGESGKDDDRYIGKYGEGYKLAMLVLTREGHRMSITTGGERWVPVFRDSEAFGGETLQLDIYDDGEDGEYTQFDISGISPAMMRSFREKFIALDRFMGCDIGAKRESEYGTILLESRFKGKFYVGGLFVQEDTQFAYGYDFLPEHVSLDRDRKAINYYELKELTARALTSCGDTPLLVNSLKERHVDLSDHDTVLEQITQEASENFKHYYYEKNGLEDDAFVGTKAMCEVSGREHVHEDNKIVSRIIAKADDTEDEFEEIEEALRKNNSRECAINAFNASDYKKILVWMKRQKRLSKSAAAELRGIIDNSRDLRFHGIDTIKGEIDKILEEEDA
jgi:hypothetical protein